MKSFLVLCFMAFATLATASDELRRRRLGGICGFPSKHGLMPPSRFTSRSAYDNYVCKENCNYNQRVCIFRTPNCGRENIGDRERAMLSKCDSTKRSCASRCRRRRLRAKMRRHLRAIVTNARRRRLGGICGFPSRYSLMSPSRFTSRSAYDNYVCKENCNYNQRVCIFRTPNCGRENIGDRERAMLSKCDSTKRSCASRCRYRRRLMAFEDELIDEQ